MGKYYKLWCVILLVTWLSIFTLGCPFKSGVKGKAWFRYAMKFDKARIELIENDCAGNKSAIPYLNKLKKMKQKFLGAKQPKEEEIVFVLKSPNRIFQRVGLVAMSLKPIETEQLIDILLKFLQDQDGDFRWYAACSIENFTKIPISKQATLGKQLLEIIKKEKAIGLSIKEFSVLAKFPSEEAALFLTEQLMKEGGGKEDRLFRLVAFKALKEMGDSYYEKAKEYVNAHGSNEIKEEFLKNEEARLYQQSEDN